jgi:hypothetical protein
VSPKADLDVLEVLKVKKTEPPHNQKLLALVSTLCLFAWPVYTENARDNRKRPHEGSLYRRPFGSNFVYVWLHCISLLFTDGLRNISVEVSNPRYKKRL